MTSKEALNQLYILADVPELAIVIQSYYNIVEKDLEVLDIFKRIDWLVFNNGDKNDFNWYIDTYSKSVKLTEEEVKKVKEWLENDKKTASGRT